MIRVIGRALRRHRIRARTVRIAAQAAAVVLLLASCAGGDQTDSAPVSTVSPTSTPVPSASPIPDPDIANAFDRQSLDVLREWDLNDHGHFNDIRVAEDGTRHLIPLEAIEWGGVARDGIPSLDRPHFVTRDRWGPLAYDPDGLVIGVEVDGKHRAYPLQILIWHEIVNETFEGKHLLVTY